MHFCYVAVLLKLYEDEVVTVEDDDEDGEERERLMEEEERRFSDSSAELESQSELVNLYFYLFCRVKKKSPP